MLEFILFQFSLGYFAFGLYVLFKNKNSLTNRMFFLLCIELSIWSLGSAFMLITPKQSTANFWRLVSTFGWCFFYSGWLDFSILLINEDKKHINPMKRLLIYIPGLYFFIGNFRYNPIDVFVSFNNGWEDIYPVNYFQISYIIAYSTFTILGILLIYKWGKNSMSKGVKIQSRIVAITCLLTFIIGASIDTILPLFGIDALSFGVISFPIALLGIYYAIIKHKMMTITAGIASEYIMDTINNPVTIVGTELSIKEVNLAALEFMGYDKEEMNGISMKKFMPNTDLNNIAFAQFNKAGFVKNIEVDLLTKDNKFITCLVSASSIYNDSNDLIGIVGVFNDITDRKNAEKALKESHQELERKVTERTAELVKSNLLLQLEISERKKVEERNQQIVKMETLGTIAGSIAHDFNNILGGIIGYTQLTLEDLKNHQDLNDNLVEVLKLGERAKNLVSQILTFSRKSTMEPHLVDMRVIIVEILNMIKTTTSATFEIKYDFYGDYPFVFANPGEMHQLIMNLCVNAKLAITKENGVIQIIMTEFLVEEDMKIQYQTIAKGMYVKIQVIDNGCGMNKSTMQRIFDPFYTTRGVQSGTGLGLSVVHGIIRNYGGLITVESELNKGSNFTVFLPRAREIVNSESVDDKTVNRSKAAILFVDDEESIVVTTEKILRREGYIVTGVLGSRNALELFSNNINSFDIVITDQSMPDMTGSVLLENIMSLRPDIPVILCSGYSNEIFDERVKSLNISELLLKPVSKNQYINAIERIMSKKH